MELTFAEAMAQSAEIQRLRNEQILRLVESGQGGKLGPTPEIAFNELVFVLGRLFRCKRSPSPTNIQPTSYNRFICPHCGCCWCGSGSQGLNISLIDGHIKTWCFANLCDRAQILKSLGLTLDDIFEGPGNLPENVNELLGLWTGGSEPKSNGPNP